MAGWALGLAIVPCFGVGLLVSIGLAVTVLVRTAKQNRDHGKGLAIAALAIAACWVVFIVISFVLGVVEGLTSDPDRDDAGRVTGRGDQSILKIRTGDCFDSPELAGMRTDEDTETALVEAAPCGEPHQFEAYHAFEIPGSEYPGVREVQQAADDGCFRAFKGFVGVGYARSVLEISYLYPQSLSWRMLDDRTVTCIVGEPGELSTGTLEDSRR